MELGTQSFIALVCTAQCSCNKDLYIYNINMPLLVDTNSSLINL